MLRLLIAEEHGDIHIRLLGQELGIANGALIRIHTQNARHDGCVRAMAPTRFRKGAIQRHPSGLHLAVYKTIGNLADAHSPGCMGAGGADHARPDDVE